MLGGGSSLYKKNGYLYYFPQVGLIIREVFNMKSIFHARLDNSLIGEAPNLLTLNFQQSIYLNLKNTINLNLASTKNINGSREVFRLELSHILYF